VKRGTARSEVGPDSTILIIFTEQIPGVTKGSRKQQTKGMCMCINGVATPFKAEKRRGQCAYLRIWVGRNGGGEGFGALSQGEGLTTCFVNILGKLPP